MVPGETIFFRSKGLSPFLISCLIYNKDFWFLDISKITLVILDPSSAVWVIVWPIFSTKWIFEVVFSLQKLFPHSFLPHLPLKQFPHPCILDEDDQGGVADLSCRLCQLAQLKNLKMIKVKMMKMIKVKMKVKIMKVEWHISPVNSHNSRTFESGQLMFQEYLACSSKNTENQYTIDALG